MASKPSHVTKGDVFDDLGLSHSEAASLKIKADLMDSILDQVKRRSYTQAQLVTILDEYQPNVSNLLQGKVSKISIEKLLRYTDRLGMVATVNVRSGSAGKIKRIEALASV